MMRPGFELLSGIGYPFRDGAGLRVSGRFQRAMVYIVFICVVSVLIYGCGLGPGTTNNILTDKIKVSYYAPGSLWRGKSKSITGAPSGDKEPLIFVLWTNSWRGNRKVMKEPMKRFGSIFDHRMEERDMKILADYIVDSGFYALPYVDESYITGGRSAERIISVTDENFARYYIFDRMTKPQKKLFLDVADTLVGIMQADKNVEVRISQPSLQDAFREFMEQEKIKNK